MSQRKRKFAQLGRLLLELAVWSSEMPLASTLAILSLLDVPEGVDPAFHIIMMRRFLAYCPEEEPRIFWMLDLISRGAQGHGPVHLLLTSAAEVCFAWDGEEKGWVRISLPPLRMMTGPIQHFCSSILEAWRHRVTVKLAVRVGFRGAEFIDFKGSLQLLTPSHLRERGGRKRSACVVSQVYCVVVLCVVVLCAVCDVVCACCMSELGNCLYRELHKQHAHRIS